MHAPKLPQTERPATLASAHLREPDRPAHFPPHPQEENGQKGQTQDQQENGYEA
jgi:hypothetical protein